MYPTVSIVPQIGIFLSPVNHIQFAGLDYHFLVQLAWQAALLMDDLLPV